MYTPEKLREYTLDYTGNGIASLAATFATLCERGGYSDYSERERFYGAFVQSLWLVTHPTATEAPTAEELHSLAAAFASAVWSAEQTTYPAAAAATSDAPTK